MSLVISHRTISWVRKVTFSSNEVTVLRLLGFISELIRLSFYPFLEEWFYWSSFAHTSLQVPVTDQCCCDWQGPHGMNPAHSVRTAGFALLCFWQRKDSSSWSSDDRTNMFLIFSLKENSKTCIWKPSRHAKEIWLFFIRWIAGFLDILLVLLLNCLFVGQLWAIR